MRQTAGVIERKTLRQNRKTGVSSQQNRVSAREAHASPHSALNIPRTNRETRRMGNALVDAIFHNEEKAEPIFPPARPNAKRRIAAQTSPRAHKRFCRSCNRPNATFRRPTIHDPIMTNERCAAAARTMPGKTRPLSAAARSVGSRRPLSAKIPAALSSESGRGRFCFMIRCSAGWLPPALPRARGDAAPRGRAAAPRPAARARRAGRPIRPRA